MRLLIILLAFPFTAFAQHTCDTIYTDRKAEVRFCSTLDSLGFDTANVVYETTRPKTYLYYSKLPADNGKCRFAVEDGKKWKTWLTAIGNVEMGVVKVNRKDVDKLLQPELIVWEMDVFGHQSATHETRRQTYTVHIWNTETATEIFRFTYLDYSWAKNSGDSAGITGTDLLYDITINNSEILIHNQRIKTRKAEDARPDPRDFCPPAEGTYRYSNGAWTKSSKPYSSTTVDITPPAYKPYWDKTPVKPKPKQRGKIREWLNRKFAKKKKN